MLFTILSLLIISSCAMRNNVVSGLILKDKQHTIKALSTRKLVDACRSKYPKGSIQIAAFNNDLNQLRIAIQELKDPDTIDKNLFYRTAMEISCSLGHLEIVRELLQRGANPIRSNINQKYNGLDYACLSGHYDVVCEILESKTQISKVIKNRALYCAAANGQLKIVQLLIFKGADILNQCRGKGTPLGVAARYGHPDVVRYLLDTYPYQHLAISTDGTYPLHGAVIEGNTECMAILMLNDKDSVNWKSDSGTPLDLAVDSNDREIVQLILREGDPTFSTVGGAMMVAFEDGKDEMFDELVNYYEVQTSIVSDQSILVQKLYESYEQKNWGEFKVIFWILKKKFGYEIESNISSKEMFINMCLEKYKEPLELLVVYSKLAFQIDDKGEDAVFAAVKSGDPEVLEILLKNKISPNRTRMDGRTPLMVSLVESSGAVAEMLVKYGADCRSRDNDGKHVLGYPVDLNGEDVINMMHQKLIRYSPNTLSLVSDSKEDMIFDCVMNKNTEALQELLENGVSPNKTRKDGKTALLLSIVSKNETAAMLLLEHGADVRFRDMEGNSILWYATNSGMDKVVREVGEKLSSYDFEGASNDGSLSLMHAHTMFWK